MSTPRSLSGLFTGATASAGGLAYARARMLARAARHPNRLQWQRIEPIREFGHFLEAARGAGMQAWLENLSADSEPRQVEYRLRARLMEQLQQAARWLPCGAGGVLAQMAVLNYLALLRAAAGSPPPGWLAEDPLCSAQDAPQVLALARLAPYLGGDGDPMAAWVEATAAQVRGEPVAARSRFLPLLAALAEAVYRPRDLEAPAQLGETLLGWIRRGSSTRLTACAWGGYLSLAYRKLRGELLSRRLFAGVGP